MRKLKVKYSFVRYSTGEIVEFGKSTVLKMKDNARFPDPEVPLSEISEAAKLLEDNYSNSMNGGGKIATAKTQASRVVYEKLLRRQADYVDKIADGDESVILSSGFTPSKIPIPSIHPVFIVKAGKAPGEVIVKRQAVKGAHSYLWQYLKDEIPKDEKDWVFAGASVQVKYVIRKLDNLSVYWFRVAPVKRKGDIIWSDPMMIMVS